MDGIYNDVYKKDALVCMSVRNNDINPMTHILTFINTRYAHECLAIFCSDELRVNEIKLMLNNFGITLTSNIEESRVGVCYIGKPANKQFDSALFYYLSLDEINNIMPLISYQKYIVTDKDLEINVDEYKMDNTIETVYCLYLDGLRSIASSFATWLLAYDPTQMGMLFSDSKYYNDMIFMGFISQLPSFSYLTLYERFRLERGRDAILKYIGLNLVRVLKEIKKEDKLYLVEFLLFDYDKELILKTALDNDLDVFESFSDDLRYKLFVISDRSYETVNKGIKLNLWSYLSVYRYNIMPLDFFDIETLAKEVEFSMDEKMEIKMFQDFDNKTLLNVAINNHFNSYENISPYIKETIFLNVYDSLESILDGVMLSLWDYVSIYEYSCNHVETKENVLIFLEKNFSEFARKVSKRSDLINEVFDDFSLDIILEQGTNLCFYMNDERKKEIFDSVVETPEFMKFYKANTWNLHVLFSWYLDKPNESVKECLNTDLMSLVQDINREKDDYLFIQLFKVFDHQRVLTFAGNCNASYLFSKMTPEERNDLFEELCVDFNSLEAGIRMEIWNIIDVYRFGLKNIMQKENIIKAISRNLSLFVNKLDNENKYDLMNQVINDFDLIDIFMAAYEQKKNIFAETSNHVQEEIIKVTFDNMEYLNWLMKNPSFNSNFVYEVCERYQLDCSKMYKMRYAEILPNIEPSMFLATIVDKSGLINESVETISKRFRKGKGRRLLDFLDNIKKDGSSINLVESGIIAKVRPDLTEMEMLELINEA